MKQLTYALVAITLLSVIATLIWQPPTPTGAAISGLGTQLVIRPQPLPETYTINEHDALSIPLSTFFTDVEGDPIFYRHSAIPPNVTLTYSHTAPTVEFINDTTTIALCHFTESTCVGAAPVLAVSTATMNTSIDQVTGKHGRGLLVESGLNKFGNPGCEATGGWVGPPSGAQLIASPDPVEGTNALNFTNIGGTEANPIWINKTTTVAPGTHTLSAYAKTGTGTSAMLRLMEGATERCSIAIPVSATYTRISCAGTLAGTAATISVTTSNTTANKSTYVDAIQLEEGSLHEYAGEGGDVPSLSTSPIRLSNTSIEFWIKPLWNGTETGEHVFARVENLYIGKGLSGENSDTLIAGYYSGGWTHASRANISNWRRDEWHHVRFTAINKYGAYLFVDGVVTNITDWSSTATSTTAYIGSDSGITKQANATIDEFRVYNRALPLPGPVSAILTPQGHYNTRGTSGIDVVFNATDPRDDEYNIQNPTRIVIEDINDPPQIHDPTDPIDPVTCTLPDYPAGCDPLAPPLSGSKCIFHNCTILDRDILQDTNTSMNLSHFVVDPDSPYDTLHFDVIFADPADSGNWTIDFAQPPVRANLTFIPRQYWNGHQYFRIKVTDDAGTSSTSNAFLVNVLPYGGAPITQTGDPDLGTHTWPEDTRYNLSLLEYVNSTSGNLRYGYTALNTSGFTLTVDAATGNTTITPPGNFSGRAEVNFTATDFQAGVHFNKKAYLNIIEVADAVTQRTTIPTITIIEDTNASINLTDHFTIPNWSVSGLTWYWEPVQPGTIAIASTYPNTTLLCSLDTPTCEKGGPAAVSASITPVAARYDGGIAITGGSMLQYNTTINTTRGTLEFWYAPSMNISANLSANSTNESILFVMDRYAESLTLRLRAGPNSSIETVARGSGELRANASLSIAPGAQTHLAVVWNTSASGTDLDLQLYVNGNLLGNASGTKPFTSPALRRLLLGSNASGGNNANGTYDELHLLPYAKTMDELYFERNASWPYVDAVLVNDNATFVPKPDYFGQHDYRLNVTDTVHRNSTLSTTFTIVVTPVDDPPLLSAAIPDRSWYEDESLPDAYNLNDHFLDPDNRTIVFGVTPSRFNITIRPDGTVNLSAPTNHYGTVDVMFNASDGDHTTWSNSVTLTIIPTSDVIAVLTPQSPANGTIPIDFYVSDSTIGHVNVTAVYSIDDGATFNNATGPSLAQLSAAEATDELIPTHDIRITSATPATAYNDIFLQAGTNADKKSRSLISFPLTHAVGSIVKRATLRLYQIAAAGETRRIGVYEVNGTWNGSTTYNHQPALSLDNGNARLIDSIWVDGSSEYKEWDITDSMRRWLDNTSVNHGLMIKDTTEPNSLGLHTFASSEYAGNVTPQLIVEYDGAHHIFDWNSIADINATNQPHTIIRLRVESNATGQTLGFEVRNNHPPSIADGAQLSHTLHDNEDVTLQPASSIFHDIDNQTLILDSTHNTSQITVDHEIDVRSGHFTVADGSGFQGAPAIAASGSGFVAVWQDTAGGRFRTRYARLNPAGSIVRQGLVFSSNIDQDAPRVAASGNRTAIVWQDDVANGDIRLAFFDGNDNPLLTINVTNTTARQRQPDVAMAGERTAVVWTDSTPGHTEAYLALYNNSGRRTGNITRISNAGLNVSEPRVAIDNEGTISVSWVQNNSRVLVLFLNSSLVNVTGVLNVSTNTTPYKAHPAIAMHAGTTRIAWADDRNVSNTSTIMLAVFNGTAKSGEDAILGDGTLRFNPDITVDSAGRTYVAFERGVGNKTEISYFRLNTTDGLITQINVTRDTLLQTRPAIASGANDTKLLLWQEESITDDVRGIGLSGETGRIIVTPAWNYSGFAAMDLSADDGYNTTTTRINFTILFIDDAPIIDDIELLVDQDSINNSVNLTPYGIDEETPAGELDWSATPATNLTLHVHTGSNLTITPDPGFAGERTVRFGLSDGVSTTQKDGTVSVVNINDPPLLAQTIPDQTWAVGATRTINLNTYFSDADGDKMNFTNSSAFNITFSYSNDGIVTMTPRPGWRGRTTVVFNATDGTNTTSSNNVTLTLARPSHLTNTTVEGTTYTGTFTNITNLDDANLTHSAITLSRLESMIATSATINNSNITRGTINTSTVKGSDLTNCTVIDSFIKNYAGTNCVQRNAYLDPDSTYNITGSTVTNSTILYSNVTYSSVTNATITWSDVNNCNISNASFSDGRAYDCDIRDHTLNSGTFTFNGNTYNAGISGPIALTRIVDYAPAASFTHDAPKVRGENVTFNASTSTDPNIPDGTGPPLSDSLTYNWTFGDGSSIATTSTTIQHNYTISGSFTATLLVIDAYDKNSTARATIDIGGGSGQGGSGGSGGGGGGGCIERWTCGEWSDCNNGIATRTCAQNSSCGTTYYLPATRKNCAVTQQTAPTPPPAPTTPPATQPAPVTPPAPTPTCNDGITNQGEEGTDCGGPCVACITTPPEPALEMPARPPTSTTTGTTTIMVLVIIIAAIVLIGSGAALVVHRSNAAIESAGEYAVKAAASGYSEETIRQRLLGIGWRPKAVDKAIYNAHLRAASGFVLERLARGMRAKDIADDLAKNGWPSHEAHRAVVYAIKRKLQK